MAINKFETAICSLLGGAMLLGMVGIWVVQLYSYLRFGEWIPVSVLTLLSQVAGPKMQLWTVAPDNWQGLHSIMGWIPLSALLFVVGAGTWSAGERR